MIHISTFMSVIKVSYQKFPAPTYMWYLKGRFVPVSDDDEDGDGEGRFVPVSGDDTNGDDEGRMYC